MHQRPNINFLKQIINTFIREENSYRRQQTRLPHQTPKIDNEKLTFTTQIFNRKMKNTPFILEKPHIQYFKNELPIQQFTTLPNHQTLVRTNNRFPKQKTHLISTFTPNSSKIKIHCKSKLTEWFDAEFNALLNLNRFGKHRQIHQFSLNVEHSNLIFQIDFLYQNHIFF